MKTLIVIPARYGSNRFPGKPLHRLAGSSMLARVVDVARHACGEIDAEFVVATDDERISRHAAEIGAPAVMTDPSLPSGSDRALAAAKLGTRPELIVNLQGDVPFTPPEHVVMAVRRALSSEDDVSTLAVQLDWEALDSLRERKRTAPHSGTTCTLTESGRTLWFSKAVIPSIRGENHMRSSSTKSPVFRHIGLYAYRIAALERFVTLPQGNYELIEGLEQLRFLEHGMFVGASVVPPARIAMSGIDTPEDAALAESLIKKYGDPLETRQFL